jgi:hypothetical protein
MSLLGRFEVTPYNAQIEIRDPDARDYPQWETGEEAVVSLPHVVVVATQGDNQGRVVVEAWQGSLDSQDATLSDAVFDGEFLTTIDKAIVGNTIGAEFHAVQVPAGRHRLRIFTSPRGAPAKKVYFLFG